MAVVGSVINFTGYVDYNRCFLASLDVGYDETALGEVSFAGIAEPLVNVADAIVLNVGIDHECEISISVGPPRGADVKGPEVEVWDISIELRGGVYALYQLASGPTSGSLLLARGRYAAHVTVANRHAPPLERETWRIALLLQNGG